MASLDHETILKRQAATGNSKLCFVTIGATADFDNLIRAVLDKAFIKELSNQGYTELRVQWGKGGRKIFENLTVESGGVLVDYAVKIENVLVCGFDFKEGGLSEDMRQAKGSTGAYGREGVIVSHAGTGSILEAFRVNSPLIVVPNESLLDNHQQELADELARQRYVVASKTTSLASTLKEVEIQRSQRVPYLSVSHRPGPKVFMEILDQEMGFID